ncbi:Uncharacterized protein XB16_1802 [Leptospira santarosai]|uniref:Uncharacterized protein n=1 Tax=Leptospira santarosai TaxID=28183 RepID=A0A2P1QT87_9LEPT|nr:Uncharacterized protein XB16_1802 [Leptospira santarosai]
MIRFLGLKLSLNKLETNKEKNQNGKTTPMNEQNSRFTSERRTMRERNR